MIDGAEFVLSYSIFLKKFFLLQYKHTFFSFPHFFNLIIVLWLFKICTVLEFTHEAN